MKKAKDIPFRFELLPHVEGSYLKKLDVKTLLFGSSNRGHQSCNSWVSRLS